MNPNKQAVGKILMEWEAPEYAHYEKSVDWYWWTGLFSVVLLGIAIWQESFLFGVLVFVGWFTVILHASKHPRIINFAITDKGILVENRVYLWHELKSFWIFYNPPLNQEISLESQHSLMPYIKIPLSDKLNHEKVRDLVKKYLQEVEQQESLIDNLSHLAKF
jgi:hypothetical protein